MEETLADKIDSETGAETGVPARSHTQFLHSETKSGARSRRMVASQLAPSGLNVRDWADPQKIARVKHMADLIWAATEIEGDPLNNPKLIKSGVLEPIRAVNGGYDGPTLVDSGETRLRAVRLLEGYDMLTGAAVEPRIAPDVITFDVFLIEPKTSITERRFGVALANEQNPFTDLEYAALIKQQLDADVPQNVIALRLGQDESWIWHINKLNSLPAYLVALLKRGQISATSAIDAVDAFGPEEAVERIKAQIEAGKGEFALEYQVAMEDVGKAEAEIERLMASGTGNEPASSSPRAPTKLQAAQRRANEATGRAKRAKRQAEQGPDKITGRQIREAKGKSPASGATATSSTGQKGKVDRASFGQLHDVIRVVAAHSQEPYIRNLLNDALERCGLPKVEFEGRKEDQPALQSLLVTEFIDTDQAAAQPEAPPKQPEAETAAA